LLLGGKKKRENERKKKHENSHLLFIRKLLVNLFILDFEGIGSHSHVA
jgi:hypothetical protein